jgi:hypothetical protein
LPLKPLAQLACERWPGVLVEAHSTAVSKEHHGLSLIREREKIGILQRERRQLVSPGFQNVEQDTDIPVPETDARH